MDFLKIIKPNQGAWILYQYIPRARFGNHLRLADIADEVSQAFSDGNAKEASRLINAYFFIAGFKTDELSGFQQLVAYYKLVELNQLQGLFAFQKQTIEPGKEPPYAYNNRFIVWWIHKLASRYGWSRNDIFELWPEEAAAYLQEIFLSEVEEWEQERSLSELAYKYDKTTKKSRFIPTPKPNWMVMEEETKTIRIRRDMLPMGEIIELDKMVH